MSNACQSSKDDFEKGMQAFLTLSDPGYWFRQYLELITDMAHEYAKEGMKLASTQAVRVGMADMP
ncbi:MAG: hypothetical protein P4L81_01605 [Candidatus Pacebacteria bacterium]|nr:hypothetical protein [Candidatus Paceibacterota bacterium]